MFIVEVADTVVFAWLSAATPVRQVAAAGGIMKTLAPDWAFTTSVGMDVGRSCVPALPREVREVGEVGEVREVREVR